MNLDQTDGLNRLLNVDGEQIVDRGLPHTLIERIAAVRSILPDLHDAESITTMTRHDDLIDETASIVVGADRIDPDDLDTSHLSPIAGRLLTAIAHSRATACVVSMAPLPALAAALACTTTEVTAVFAELAQKGHGETTGTTLAITSWTPTLRLVA